MITSLTLASFTSIGAPRPVLPHISSYSHPLATKDPGYHQSHCPGPFTSGSHASLSEQPSLSPAETVLLLLHLRGNLVPYRAQLYRYLTQLPTTTQHLPRQGLQYHTTRLLDTETTATQAIGSFSRFELLSLLSQVLLHDHSLHISAPTRLSKQRTRNGHRAPWHLDT